MKVDKYDRGTSQKDRQRLRDHPPHVLLTNYMMLEYLLTRPSDRDSIFANHRCRFLVLDEVHTYRGALGANIALLVRRLHAHLGMPGRTGAQRRLVTRQRDGTRRWWPLERRRRSRRSTSPEEAARKRSASATGQCSSSSLP